MRLAPERSRRQLLPSPTHATPIDRAAWRRQGRKIGVACELRYRAAKKGSLALSGRVDELLSAIEILPLDEGVDGKYAEIRAALERAGTPIGANDYLIAAHALATDLTLVTDNVGEFSRVPGLAVENWLAS